MLCVDERVDAQVGHGHHADEIDRNWRDKRPEKESRHLVSDGPAWAANWARCSTTERCENAESGKGKNRGVRTM